MDGNLLANSHGNLLIEWIPAQIFRGQPHAGSREIRRQIHSNQWKSMEIIGNVWNSKGFQGGEPNFSENQWDSFS